MESTECYLGSVSVERIDLPSQAIKENDAQLFAKLKASIAKRGQLKTVLVCLNEQGRYDCLEGGKIVLAMKELDKKTVDAMVMPVTLSEQEKKQIRLELSRDYFLTNYVLIGQMLKELAESEKLNELCATIPFDVRQAENLIAMSDFDWEAFAQNKQVEGQISMFDAFSETEPDYENVVGTPNPEYIEPVKIEEQPKVEQLREERDAEIEDAQKQPMIEVAGTEVNLHEGSFFDEPETEDTQENKALLPDGLSFKAEYTLHSDHVKAKQPEPEPEPILKEVAPELFQEDVKTEPIEGATTQKEFEELLDSRPTAAQDEAPQEVAFIPEALVETDQPFYIDHRNVLVIKKYADQILPNLVSVAESILIKKEFEKIGQIDLEKLKISTQEEEGATIVSHIIYVSRFDVKYTVKLKDVYDFLTRIDFEEV
jgi:hypothetical protein